MPIEFRCPRCGRLLRTPDDTAGKQAQCPACGTLSTIPPPSPLPTEASVSPGPPPDRPMDAGPAAAAAGAERPYQAPGSDAFFIPPAQRVYGPATALIVVGVVGIAGHAVGVLANLAHMALGARAFRVPDELHLAFSGGIGVTINLFGMAVGLFILIAAIQMKRLESRSLAMAAAIVAMLPCISPCCLLGLPFGIWALIVLNDSSVRAAFRR